MKNNKFEEYYMNKKKQYDLLARQFMNASLDFNDITRQLMYSYIDVESLENKKVLDVGCGYGQDLDLFSRAGAEVYGIDISRKLISLAREKCPVAKLTVGTFENLPFEDNYFDLAFSRYSLQHSEKASESLEEISRVLKPEGEAIILVTHPVRQYFEKETKNYWQREEVRSNILDGKLVVFEPSHTLADYLKMSVLQKLRLLDIKEAFDPAAEKIQGCGEYPGVLMMYFKKE
ncbi:MAG: class I SAM-dependent methyltransferase [Candidatus Nanoarchaeia archaeon]